jgi:MFS family permease
MSSTLSNCLIVMHSAGFRPFLGDNKKAVAINVLIVSNAFIWYSYAFKYLLSAINTASLSDLFLPIIATHFLGVLVAIIIGQFLSQKVKQRDKFILWWMLAGVFLSLLPLITGMTANGIVVFSVITGINFGFGIPVCLGYFASTTEPSHRGKLGGLIFLIIGVGVFIISRIGNESVTAIPLVLAVWRALGFLFLFFIKPDKQMVSQQQLSYKHILSNRPFLLYYIPWIMFLFVNSLAFPIIEKRFSPDLVSFSTSIEFVLGGLSGAIFGFFADSIGRKRLAVAGFALLGLGYAILGFTNGDLVGWWVYTLIDGIAWGTFVMLFVFTLWGDLAEGRNSERIYAIGIIPYLLSTFLRYSVGSLLTPYFQSDDITPIFSFLSFFLFVGVLPLVFAPETLAEHTIKNNDLKSYISKAQKQVSKKEKQSKFKKNVDAQEEPQDKSEEYKKAQELAEKYY